MDTVLVIDADDAQRALLVELLQRESFETLEAAESSQAVRMVLERQPSLVAMAESMPPLEGVELLPLLRRLTRVPIVVIGMGGEIAVVRALAHGADAYVSLLEDRLTLGARFRALLRRHQARGTTDEDTQPDAEQALAIGAWVQRLSPTEARLLSCLLAQRNGVVRREDLLFQVWNGKAGWSALRYHIHHLRRKLASTNVVRILNHRGIGYRLLLCSSPS